MGDRPAKLGFLDRVLASAAMGPGESSLMTTDDFARDNVLVACEAIQLGLVRLRREADGHGLRITRAGRLLAMGDLELAAAAIDSGMEVVRLAGDAPSGLLGARLHPGSPGIHLGSMSARRFAPEIMRGVATGHLVVDGKTVRAARAGEASQTSWASKAARIMRAADAVSAKSAPAGRTAALPSSRSIRHVGGLEP